MYYICTGYVQKLIVMIVVSTREFRDNQKSYLDKIDSGIEILIQRGKSKCYKIVPLSDDDTLMSKESFFTKIESALQEAKDGKSIAMQPEESLDDFLNRVKKSI